MSGDVNDDHLRQLIREEIHRLGAENDEISRRDILAMAGTALGAGAVGTYAMSGTAAAQTPDPSGALGSQEQPLEEIHVDNLYQNADSAQFLEVVVQEELGLPTYDDVTTAPQTLGRVVYATGNGPSAQGLWQYNGTNYVQVGGGATGQWEETGSGEIVPIDGETIGDGTTDANHASVDTDEADIKQEGAYHNAWAYGGGDPDNRLNNAINAASGGEVIYLEDANYTDARTISKGLSFVGTQSTSLSGTPTQFSADWTFNARCRIIDIVFEGGRTVAFNDRRCLASRCSLFGSDTIQVNDDRCLIDGCWSGTVVFASGTTEGLVDGCVATSVTDNGTNTVGDIT